MHGNMYAFNLLPFVSNSGAFLCLHVFCFLHFSPVPGSAEHGYLFGGMDFCDHQQFDPYAYVGEPWPEELLEQRRSRRDLHWGPPRRRGDFFGLDYTTMPGATVGRSLSAEDAQFYQGYQPLPPRKNFRLCGRFTADPDAPTMNM